MNEKIILYIEYGLRRGIPLDKIKGQLRVRGYTSNDVKYNVDYYINQEAKKLHQNISEMINVGFSLFEIRRHFVSEGMDYRIVDKAISKFKAAPLEFIPTPSKNILTNNIDNIKIKSYVKEQLKNGFTIERIKSILFQ